MNTVPLPGYAPYELPMNAPALKAPPQDEDDLRNAPTRCLNLVIITDSYHKRTGRSRPGGMFPCGKCGPCRATRAFSLANRIHLESLDHAGKTSFATLTYRDEDLPPFGSLTLRDPTLWLKRLRKALEPEGLRYFYAGQYGGTYGRAHYHAILYGISPCERGETKKHPVTNKPLPETCCDHCRLLAKTWGKGFIESKPYQQHNAPYVARYVVQPSLYGQRGARIKEFGRWSKHPALGVGIIPEFASTLMEYGLDESLADVPAALRIGSQIRPIGRTLVRKTREAIGKELTMPEELRDLHQANLRECYEAAEGFGPGTAAEMAQQLWDMSLSKARSRNRPMRPPPERVISDEERAEVARLDEQDYLRKKWLGTKNRERGI